MKTSGYDWGPLDYYGTHIIDYNISGDSVNGTIDNGSDTMSFTMGMKKDGLDYYILSITIQRSPEDFVIKALR